MENCVTFCQFFSLTLIFIFLILSFALWGISMWDKSPYPIAGCWISYIKHLLDETESNIQFIASGQGNIGRSEAEPNVILYGRNQLDVGRGQVQ